FFFQAEDGIRDRTVTGVQTCALPICTFATKEATASQRMKLPAASLNSPVNTRLWAARRASFFSRFSHRQNRKSRPAGRLFYSGAGDNGGRLTARQRLERG